MRKLLMFVLYFVVVTPAGLALRVFRDPMARRPDRGRASYWNG